MSYFFKIFITISGGIGLIITTEKVIVELTPKTITVFLICTIIFAVGLITLTKHTNKVIMSNKNVQKITKPLIDKYKSLTKKNARTNN